MALTDVLTVGSGPVGLNLAFELRMAGLSVLVIDLMPAREARDRRSNALSMSASSLEIFPSRGIAQEFITRGSLVETAHFGGCATPIILGAEADTETILLDQCDAIGVQFKWGFRFESLQQSEDTVPTVACHEDEGLQKFKSRWIAGCDGTHSAVRAALGVPFEGTHATLAGWIADVYTEAPPARLPAKGLSPQGNAMMLPIPGRPFYRVFRLSFATMHERISTQPTLDEIRTYLQQTMGTDYGIHSPVWLGRFGDACRIAGTYQVKRAFLAGDAAHQFFPAGVQGMNLGIQDANNLAWKLINAKSNQQNQAVVNRLYHSYTRERRAAAVAVATNVHAQMHIIKAREPDKLAIRDVFAEALQHPDTNRLWALRLSGFGDPVAPYLDTYLADETETKDIHPLVGQRVTHIRFDAAKNLLHAASQSYKFILIRVAVPQGQLSVEDLQDVTKPWRHSVIFLMEAAQPTGEKWEGIEWALARPDLRIAWVGDNKKSILQSKQSLAAVLRWWLG
ncbi:hypothetical protein CBS147332_8377 [Penicillium roqueforti]|nr:hypothetical protein CBS147332_8377 [Penicillium roqueforti]KAI3100049.1 hypothetical protein CBS147331_8420 [Penicillium roqueforti]